MKKVELAADIIIPNKKGKILILKRKITPEKGKLTLPGGHLEENETIEETAVREAKEETGLEVELKDILGVYSNPDRDPRGREVSTAFIAEEVEDKPIINEESSEALWKHPQKLKEEDIGFDHWKMIQHYIQWKKNKETYWSSKE